MLHELVVALLGHFGDLFVESPIQNTAVEPASYFLNKPEWLDLLKRHKRTLQLVNRPLNTIAYNVSSHFNVVHPAEAAAVNEICSLGARYALLTACATLMKSSACLSFYWKAFGTAIINVLDDYLKLVVTIETKINTFSDPDTFGKSTPLTFLLQQTKPWQLTMALLSKVIADFLQEPESYAGCLVIGKLFSHRRSGFPQYKRVIGDALQSTSRLFYKQLVSLASTGSIGFAKGEFCLTETGTGICIEEHKIPPFLSRDIAVRVQVLAQTMVQLQNKPALYAKFSQIVESELTSKCTYLVQSVEPELHRIALENTLCHLEETMSEALWSTAVASEKLPSALRFTQTVVFLTRPDIFEEFFKTASKQESELFFNWTLLFDHILESELRSLAPKSLRSQFRLIGGEPQLVGALPVKLEIAPAWPLALFISPTVVAAYTDIFSGLIVLRQAHWALRQVMQFHSGFRTNLWTIRSVMYGFIDRFWSYLQSNVLNQPFAQLDTFWEQSECPRLMAAVREHGSSIAALSELWFSDPSKPGSICFSIFQLSKSAMLFAQEAIKLLSGDAKGDSLIDSAFANFQQAQTDLCSIINDSDLQKTKAIDKSIYNLYFENAARQIF